MFTKEMIEKITLTEEDFYKPICPKCGSDFGDWDRTEEPNQVWRCFACGTIKFKNNASTQKGAED